MHFNDNWPFKDKYNVMVLTTKSIMKKKFPILYVSHDIDDGMWQFLDGTNVKECDAMIVSLEEIVEKDATVKILADLPLGWIAWRKSPKECWIKQKQ